MRITPADAGKTTFMADIAACIWDHPRRCGENRSYWTAVEIQPGSPPQVRGKLVNPPIRTKAAQDHPRRCGENSLI